MINEISRKYARAFFDRARSDSLVQQTLQELRVIQGVLVADPNIRRVFSSPLITPSDKKEIIQNAFGSKVSPAVLDILNLMNEKRRLEFFEGVVLAFEGLSDEASNIVRGSVFSANELNADFKKSLENKIQRMTEKNVLLSYQVDPHLMGGVTVRVGGLTINDSLDFQLTKMNDELNRSAT